jgi:bifunctional non-homologous end joining protein LigD
MSPLDRAYQRSFPFRENRSRFIVHEHQATRHHFDLRLEHNGSLLDFVLPKGPSLDPSVTRLAIRCRNHHLSCLTFEGVIRPGAYGAGPLLAWDRGYFKLAYPQGPIDDAIFLGLRKGILRLTFEGHKMRGTWLLKAAKDNWLFTKEEDEHASRVDILLQDKSVFTGQTLREVGRQQRS